MLPFNNNSEANNFKDIFVCSVFEELVREQMVYISFHLHVFYF